MSMSGFINSKQTKMNAYMNFVKKMRPIIVKDNPDMGFTDIGKELGRVWRSLSQEEKQAYDY